MGNNLPVVDSAGARAAGIQITRAPIERCPTGAIVWLDPRLGPQKGAAARPVVRQSALAPLPT
jgi:hypothetical protein